MDFERTGRFRATFLCGALLVLFAGLAVRLAQIQLIQKTTHASGAWRQQVSRRVITALRGRILDRNGYPLALSVPARSLHADPGEVEDAELAAARFAPLLGYPEEDLVSLLGRRGRFVRLHRRIEDRDLLRRIAKLDLPWIGQEYEPARHYPGGRMAANVLGIVGEDGNGLEGLERILNSRLEPSSGYRLEERDGSRTGVRISGTIDDAVPARPGEDVRLAMDYRIQSFAEEALDALVAEWTPEDAVAVVMDPRTGDILASATRPTFDPAGHGGSDRDDRINRVASCAYEVGSALKPLVVGVGLERGAVRSDSTIDCEGGSYKYPKARVVKDHHAMGAATLTETLIHSSNIAMVKIGQKLGCEALHDGLVAMGLGRSTRSGFPGESKGIMTPRARWTEHSTLRSVAFGQEIAVTPLQLARAFSAIATDGLAPRPRYLLDGSSPERERILTARNAAFLRGCLARVVEEGTGRRAKLGHWRVGGKTGTADILTEQGKDGYIATFVGLAPVGDPRFVVVVIAKRPRTDKGTPYGGTVSAPAVKAILERSLRLLGVPSDAL